MENDKVKDASVKKGQEHLNRNGRPKGTLNKVTKAAKDAIAEAAEALGGADRLTAWAKEDPANERVFWGTIYPKLLPLQVHGSGEDGEILIQQVVRRIVDPNKHENTHD